jgi:hypothetical protein
VGQQPRLKQGKVLQLMEIVILMIQLILKSASGTTVFSLIQQHLLIKVLLLAILQWSYLIQVMFINFSWTGRSLYFSSPIIMQLQLSLMLPSSEQTYYLVPRRKMRLQEIWKLLPIKQI